MNKNLNNQNDKGAQRGQMQPQGVRQNDISSQGGGTNLDRDREPRRVESWSNPSPEKDKEIHPAEPSGEKNLNRERETQPLGRESNLNREKTRQESTIEKTIYREKEASGVNSESAKNTGSGISSPSFRAQAMNNRETAYKSSAFQSSSQNQERKLTDELKAPAMTGTALYVIAAILLIGWAVGFFYYNAGPAIHILLVLALVSVLIKVVQGRNV
jgi:hypothetical protein